MIIVFFYKNYYNRPSIYLVLKVFSCYIFLFYEIITNFKFKFDNGGVIKK